MLRSDARTVTGRRSSGEKELRARRHRSSRLDSGSGVTSSAGIRIERRGSIDSLDVLAGWLPGRALSIVRDWAGAHAGELREIWELARDAIRTK